MGADVGGAHGTSVVEGKGVNFFRIPANKRAGMTCFFVRHPGNVEAGIQGFREAPSKELERFESPDGRGILILI
jgi:hypothetical protein